MDKDQKYENEKEEHENQYTLQSYEQKLKDRSLPLEYKEEKMDDSSDSKSLSQKDYMKDDSSSIGPASPQQVSDPLKQISEKNVASSQKDVFMTSNKLNIPPQYSEWKALAELDSLPLMKSGYSLEADMKFGWKPQIKGKVLPIPLVFDIEDELICIDQFGPDKQKLPVLYQGWRPADSLKMHKKLLNSVNSSIHGSNYPFKIPSDLPLSVQRLLDQQMQERVLGGKSFGGQRSSYSVTNAIDKDTFVGMNPDQEIKEMVDKGSILSFDSTFESGNLDRVVMVTPKEYDLFMRLDTNSRGHHQWFYFKVNTKTNVGKVKFNILNFTKSRSLYEYGMKICVCSKRERELHIENKRCNGDEESAGWKREGNDIIYKASKLNKIIEKKIELEIQEGNTESNLQTMRRPKFYQLSFTYEFNNMEEDDVYFAYSFPYTFTRLTRFLKDLKAKQEFKNYLKDCTPLCHSLSGVDVPYLVVTTRANEKEYMKIEESEHTPNSLPAYKQKQIVVLTGRVHPGETNASYMMEGFIKFITSPTDPVAIELRKRIVFRIVPCINPDGVISGNYRVSMSGNDLNRRYQSPHPKLHPIVCAVKKIFKDINPSLEEDENQILAFIDMHGHSRKKNVFMYGPEYPIHDNRYLKIRIFPKLMSEKTQMFRFFSSKFRIQRSKEKTARVVLWREFNIMNCFTLEASFQGYFNHDRETRDFLPHHFYDVGRTLAKTIFEYIMMKEEEQRVLKAKRLQKQKQQKSKIQQQNVRKNSGEKSKDSKNRRGSSAGKAVLSPSASSEACIDDQQPQPLFQKDKNTKITKISKKLQQQSKGQGNSKTPNTEQKKQKFKNAGKKFKEDVPPLAPKKSKANPNMPDEEIETQQEEQININESSQAHDKIDNFISQFTMKNRTFNEMFNQIKDEEEKEKQNEDDSDSNNDEIKSQNGKSDKDSMGSDDDQNNLLLRKIHGKILDVVMKCEQAAVPGSNSAQPKNLKKIISSNSKEKTAKKKQITLYTTHKSEQSKKEVEKNTSKLSQVQSDYSKSKVSGQPGTLAQQILQQAKKSSKNKDSKLMQGGLRRNDSHSAGLYNAQVIQQKRERAKHLSQHSQYHLSSSAHYSNIQSDINHEIIQTFQQQNLYNGPGIILQMNNNNFNDRIITQQYNKYKKNLFGSNPLQTLQNSNQIVQQKLRNENLFKDQSQVQQQPQFTFYNFQQRNQQQQNQGQIQPKDNEMPLIQQRLITNQQPESRMDIQQKMQSFRQLAQHNGNQLGNQASHQSKVGREAERKDINSYYQPQNGLRAARVSINTAMTTQIQSQSSLKEQNQLQIVQSGSPTVTMNNSKIENHQVATVKSVQRAGVSSSGFKRRNRKIVPPQTHQTQPLAQTNTVEGEIYMNSPEKIPHITQQKLFGMQSLIEVAQKTMHNEYVNNGHFSQQERKSANNSRLHNQIPASAGHNSQKGESLTANHPRGMMKDQTILALQSQGAKKSANVSMIQYKQNHTQGKLHRNEGFQSEADIQNHNQGLSGIKSNQKRSRGYETTVKNTSTKEFMNLNDTKDITPQKEQLKKQQTFQQQLPRHRAILVQGFAARVESTPQKEKETIFQAHKMQSQSFQQPSGLRSVQVRGMALKSVSKNRPSEEIPTEFMPDDQAKQDLKKQNERYIERPLNAAESDLKEKYFGNLVQQQLIDKKSYQIKFLKSLEELDKHIEMGQPIDQSAPQMSENQSRLIISDNINIEVDKNQ